MAVRFVIVDDDISICRMIENIIEEHKLGIVVAQCGDGAQGAEAICECQPDIAIVDLLLPIQDGVQMIEKIRQDCEDTAFIMISQASSEPLVTRAYRSGIEFFIHKPINVLELVSIVNKVQANRKLKKSMSLICNTTAQYSAPLSAIPPETYEDTQKTKIYKAFSDLGIIGETGAKDIYKMAQLIRTHTHNAEDEKYQLFDIYQQLSVKLNQDAKTIKQRVRRTIGKTLQSLASIGAEDYYNETFQMYSTTLFDFKEVRVEMDFIKGKGQHHGKINVKTFIEGLLFIAD